MLRKYFLEKKDDESKVNFEVEKELLSWCQDSEIVEPKRNKEEKIL